jgi:hypothetical protein
MCDRDKTSRAGSQINFIEFVVAPLFAQVGASFWLWACLESTRVRPAQPTTFRNAGGWQPMHSG